MGIDKSAITACGGCCTGCQKRAEGICRGCIEADGYVPEWADSGRCRVHACARRHGVQFCGICGEFPCGELTNLIHWEKDIVARLTALAEEYRREI